MGNELSRVLGVSNKSFAENFLSDWDRLKQGNTQKVDDNIWGGGGYVISALGTPGRLSQGVAYRPSYLQFHCNSTVTKSKHHSPLTT